MSPDTKARSNISWFLIGSLNIITVITASSQHRNIPGIIHVGAAIVATGLHIRLALSAQTSSQRVVIYGLLPLSLACAIFAPPRDSNDVYSYAFYGWTLVHYHLSPYSHTAIHFLNDPVARHVTNAWRDTPSVYGPLFSAISAAIMFLVRRSAFGARIAFQTLSAVGLVAMAFVVTKHFKRRDLAVLLLACPLVVASAVNGGHNDTLVGLGIVLGVMFFERGKRGQSAISFAAAGLIKLSALVAPAALVVILVRDRKLRDATIFASIAFGLSIIGYGLLAPGIAKPLSTAAKLRSTSSIWHLPIFGFTRPFLGIHFTGLGDNALFTQPLVAVALFGVILLVFLLLTERKDAPFIVAASTFIYLATARYVLPWYALWALPLAWMTFTKRQQILMHAYLATLFIGYLSRNGLKPGALNSTTHTILLLVTPLIAVAMTCELVREPLANLSKFVSRKPRHAAANA